MPKAEGNIVVREQSKVEKEAMHPSERRTFQTGMVLDDFMDVKGREKGEERGRRPHGGRAEKMAIRKVLAVTWKLNIQKKWSALLTYLCCFQPWRTVCIKGST